MPMLKNLSAASLPVIFLAGAAAANCPTSLADTADGVHVTFSDFHVRYDRQNDGTVIEEEFYIDGGDGFRLRSLHGAYVLESTDTREGARVYGTNEVTEFADGIASLPLLAPGQSWQGNSVRTYEGGEVNHETITIEVGAAQNVTIGDCALVSWPVVVTTFDTVHNETFFDELSYLPALGFAIYHGGAEQGTAFTRDEPTGISTEPPFMTEEGMLLAVAPPFTPPALAPQPAPTPAPLLPPAPVTPSAPGNK